MSVGLCQRGPGTQAMAGKASTTTWAANGPKPAEMNEDGGTEWDQVSGTGCEIQDTGCQIIDKRLNVDQKTLCANAFANMVPCSEGGRMNF